LSEICGRVDAAGILRHLQRMVHQCVFLQPILNSGKSDLGLVIGGTRRTMEITPMAEANSL